MLNNKKANFAPVITTGVILFNVFVFILISAFAADDTAIGSAGDVYSSIDEVNTTYDTNTVVKPSFMNRFLITLTGLPWWVNIFLFFANAILIPITILAWVRGL